MNTYITLNLNRFRFVLCGLLFIAVCIIGSYPTFSHESAQTPVNDNLTTEQSFLRCGATCLYLICRYHDIPVTYAEMVEALDPKGVGVSFLQIKNVAHELGLETKFLKIHPRYFYKFSPPFIAWFSKSGNYDKDDSMGHFIIIVPIPAQEGFWLIDPPRKKKWIDVDSVSEDFSDSLPVMLFRPQLNDK